MNSSFSGNNNAVEERYKRYQNRLVPANIVVMIIALVAIISQLFMPMVSVRITLTGENITQIVNFIHGNNVSTAVSDDELDMIEYVSRDVDTTVDVGIYPLNALMLGVNPQPDAVRDYLSMHVWFLEGAADLMFAQMLPRLSVYIVARSIQEQTGEAIGFEILEQIGLEKINTFTQSIDEGNFDQARAQFRDAVDSIASDLGYELTESNRETIMAYYDEAIAAGLKEDGTFSYTNAIEVLAEKYGIDLDGYLNGRISLNSVNDSMRSATAATLSEDTGSGAEDSEDGESGAEDTESGDVIIEKITAFISMIPDEYAQIVGTALFAVSAAVIGLTTLLWLILAIFAFVRTFLSNKCFTMWYVKLFCWLPCVLFVIAPMVFAAIYTEVLAGLVTAEVIELLDLIFSIPFAFGGSGIVSGICLAVLWLVSIFWLFPIKRQIRKLKNNHDL